MVGRERVTSGLLLVCLLKWELVTQVCSIFEDSALCACNICTFLYVCVLYLNKNVYTDMHTYLAEYLLDLLLASSSHTITFS